MGVVDILPRILPSAGRQNYDLRALADGLVCFTSEQLHRQKGHEGDTQDSGGYQDEPAAKRCRSFSNQRSFGWKRRKFRIAVDVNVWIARAVHGNGAYLLDDRHLTYRGRAELKREQRQLLAYLLSNDDGVTNGLVLGKREAQTSQKRLEYIAKCVAFVLNRIELLHEECRAEVLSVLDGNSPPCKINVVKKRSNQRKLAAKQRDHLSNSSLDSGFMCEGEDAANTEAEALARISASKRAGMGMDSSILEDTVNELIKEFHKRQWPFLVAPYEADGQLAYLANIGAVDLVITEDSDLIAHGVPSLIYRLGGWNGYSSANREKVSKDILKGTLLHRCDLGSAHGINLLDFSDAMLAVMFVAAGCDYCESLKGIGILTARDIVKSAFDGNDAHRNPVLKIILEQLFQTCTTDARAKYLPLDDPKKQESRLAYEESFLAALAMYRHPLVYDPILGAHIVSNDVSDDSKAIDSYFLRDEILLMEYKPYKDLVTIKESLYQVIGRPLDPKTAKEIAEGFVDARKYPEEIRREIDQDATEINEQKAISLDDDQNDDDQNDDDQNDDDQNDDESDEMAQLEENCTQPSGVSMQQSKSSSITHGGMASSLSPDLLE